jgi:peptide/nickel transport system substrate-binding protein
MRTLDRAGRQKIYARVQEILARDVPVVSLWHEDNIAAMRKNVSGFEMLPTAQLTNLENAEKTKR